MVYKLNHDYDLAHARFLIVNTRAKVLSVGLCYKMKVYMKDLNNFSISPSCFLCEINTELGKSVFGASPAVSSPSTRTA